MGTIRFELRAEKTDKKGNAPVRLIYQVSGQRRYYHTGKKLLPACWDSKNQQAIYIDKRSAKRDFPGADYDLFLTASEVSELNRDLEKTVSEIRTIEKRFELDKTVYSAEMVIEHLKNSHHPKTKKEAPSNLVFDFIEKYIQDHASIWVPGSLSVYKALKNHLGEFQRDTGCKVSFQKIDYSFFESFQNYLIGTKKLSNVTTWKRLSTLKTFLSYARKQGIEVPGNYTAFKIGKQSLEVIALTNKEFESLYYLDLTENKRLAQVRDVFCFACVTGLRYSDLFQLKREHIKEDEIKLTVKKTKEPLSIPLTPYSKNILSRYESMQSPLPVISNQKLNVYIKELCQIAGITEPVEIVRFRGAKREAYTYPKYELIGVHTGRKTFATLSLERGMSAEEVMSITGHKDYHSFKRYVKITEQRKKIVMIRAWENISPDFKIKAV